MSKLVTNQELVVVYQDKPLTCKTCKQAFVWTRDEQLYFATHGLMNAPKHCIPCRAKRHEYFKTHNTQTAEKQ